tara:strand:+ start:207 stop:419 length:213 start_codon:yes stop_codon:yes gene_type:complete
MKKFKTIIMLLLIIAVLIFAIQNVAAVEIQFLLWSFSIPRALMILLLLGTGFVIGLLVASLLRFRQSAKR